MTERDRLIEENLDLAHAIARRLAASIPRYGMIADELDSEAQLQLVVAAERYDASRGVPFREWAAWFLDRRLREGMRRKALRDATHSQLPERYDVRSTVESPEEIVQRAQVCQEVRRALASLPARSRKIVELRYRGDRSHRSVGEEVGLRSSRTGQIHAQVLAELRVKLSRLAEAA
jgi:RNA polymerase sigma factor (sigma-70 family)